MTFDISHALDDLDIRTPQFLKVEALRYGGNVELEVADLETVEQDWCEEQEQVDEPDEARATAMRTLRTQGDPRATQLLKEILRLSAEQGLTF